MKKKENNINKNEEKRNNYLKKYENKYSLIKYVDNYCIECKRGYIELENLKKRKLQFYGVIFSDNERKKINSILGINIPSSEEPDFTIIFDEDKLDQLSDIFQCIQKNNTIDKKELNNDNEDLLMNIEEYKYEFDN
jgi:hypothetical protein